MWQIIDQNKYIQNGASLYKGSEFKKQLNKPQSVSGF